jgi:hypothetical protein
MNIILQENNYNFEIENLLANKYKNVINYKYTLCKPELIITTDDNVENIDNSKDCEIFYIFDCPGEDAFAHWIFESFLFYTLFMKIRDIYPNVKIVAPSSKQYIKNMFDFLKIDNEIVKNINSFNNICFFSQVVSLNNMTRDYGEMYSIYLSNMIHDFEKMISQNTEAEKNRIVLLPRNKKDNYVSNDRVIYGIEDIEENILKIGGLVLNTYELGDIGAQLSIISESEIIILDYGSSYFFNSMFVKNKKIIVLNNYELYRKQIDTYYSYNLLSQIIQNNNTVIIVDPNNSSLEIKYSDIECYLN